MIGPLFITGHGGLAGSALLRAAAEREILTASRAELDLRNADLVSSFLAQHRPCAIIHAAARNAGIALHEAEPAALLADNLAIAINVIRAAAEARVPRLLYISSAAVYAAGPTAGYALAKIAGMALCDAVRTQYRLTFHSIIPCNLYGPGDKYDPQYATVVAGMMRRMHEAAQARSPQLSIWGTGKQTREFLHADDLAAACLLLLNNPDPPPRVNCGPGLSTTILDLAVHLKAVTGYPGTLVTDPSKPEGTPRPPLDCTFLRNLGWTPRIALPEGLAETYAAFKAAILAGTLRG